MAHVSAGLILSGLSLVSWKITCKLPLKCVHLCFVKKIHRTVLLIERGLRHHYDIQYQKKTGPSCTSKISSSNSIKTTLATFPQLKFKNARVAFQILATGGIFGLAISFLEFLYEFVWIPKRTKKHGTVYAAEIE